MTQLASHRRAMLYALLAFAIYTVGDSFTKFLGQDRLPVPQIIAGSSVFCMLTIVAIAAMRGRLRALRPVRLKLELARGAFYTIISFVNVTAFTHLPLAAVYVGLFTCPMLVALFAAVALGERLSSRQTAAIAAGFGGILVALLPEHENLMPDGTIGLVALVLFPVLTSIHVVCIRYMSRFETSASLAFFPIVVRLVLVLPFCLGRLQPMTAVQVGALAGMGGCMGVGILLSMMALKRAPAGIVYPFQYSQLIIGAILGYLIWGDVPSPYLFAGAAVIIVAGLYVARHGSQPAQGTERAVETA